LARHSLIIPRPCIGRYLLPFTVPSVRRHLLASLTPWANFTCAHLAFIFIPPYVNTQRQFLHLTTSHKMLTALLLSSFTAISLAAPLAQYGPAQRTNVTAWEPAPGSKTTCDKTSDKIIGFYQGPQLETVLDNACAEMMSPCAYQERLSQDIVCVQTVTWKLPESVSSVQDANVETSEGNKISGWDVKCECSNSLSSRAC
jgi:putative effector of murein hydrolase LrgA (UPF0299 family)